eukprot:203650-Pyramimonas_sp.AAC.1
MQTGLAHPLIQRPLVKGLPWQEFQPWSNDRLKELARAARAISDDMHKMPSNLDPGKQSAEEWHQFLLVDNPSLEVTSKLHAGCANLLEAAQRVDIIRALLPAMEEGVTVR